MINDGIDTGSHLERNVERMLSAANPPLGMPDSVKERILAKLTRDERVVTPMPQRRRGWMIAAAAVVVMTLIGLWPVDSPSGISWADVVDRISDVTTLRARLDADAPAPGGETRRMCSIIYEKDPGLYRSETLTVGGEIELVTVFRRKGERAEQLLLFPGQRRAVRTVHVFRGTGDNRLPELNRVSQAWRHLVDIAGSDAYRVGEEERGGRPTIGFEIPAEEFFAGRSASVRHGTVRLWADRVTAEPVTLEVDFVDSDGRRTRAVLSDIEWDVELGDELFEMAVPKGWSTEETRREVLTFKTATLAADVRFRIAPEGGQDLITETDVEAVRSVESNSSLTIDDPAMVVLVLKLAPSAWRRIDAYRSASPTSLLVADFNAETRVVPSFEGDGLLRLDLSRLGKPIEKIEDDYIDAGDRGSNPTPTDIE